MHQTHVSDVVIPGYGSIINKCIRSGSASGHCRQHAPPQLERKGKAKVAINTRYLLHPPQLMPRRCHIAPRVQSAAMRNAVEAEDPCAYAYLNGDAK